jgi:hypothetical protein
MNIVAWYEASLMWPERLCEPSEFSRKVIRNLDADKNPGRPRGGPGSYII